MFTTEQKIKMEKRLQKVYDNCIDELEVLGYKIPALESLTINYRAKSRWGQCRRHRNGLYSININSDLVRLDLDNEKGLRETLFHEIGHVLFWNDGHKGKWLSYAELINDCYLMDIQRCSDAESKMSKESVAILRKERIKNEKPYHIYKVCCSNCGYTYKGAYKRTPKWYSKPQLYRCTKCKGNLIRL